MRPIALLALATLLLAGGCKMLYRSLRHNVPSVHDHRLFPARTIHRAGEAYPLHRDERPLPPVEQFAFGKWARPGISPERFLESTGTVAFLVMRGDTILYERYFHGNDAGTAFNGFSMGKAYLSALIGIAIEEGHIGSIDQSIGDYLPWCTDSTLCAVKIRHLLQMTSGIASSEGYLNPWSTSTRLYYGDDLWRSIDPIRLQRSPGDKYFYQNINSQLLGMVLAEATGRPLGEYLEEKIWKPLGMEADASWSLHPGTDIEKAFCCLNARARDFARFGLLYLNQGRWQGKQIVPAHWASLPLAMDTTEGAAMHYQWAWYTNLARQDYYAQGLLGQFTYIHPATRTVIVRLGNNLEFNVPWYDIFRFISGADRMPQEQPMPISHLRAFEGRWEFGLGKNGDSTMIGKHVIIKAKRKGLVVSSNFQKTWTATPSDSLSFFNLEFARRLHFSQDSAGTPNALHWARRGLEWGLAKPPMPGPPSHL